MRTVLRLYTLCEGMCTITPHCLGTRRDKQDLWVAFCPNRMANHQSLVRTGRVGEHDIMKAPLSSDNVQIETMVLLWEMMRKVPLLRLPQIAGPSPCTLFLLSESQSMYVETICYRSSTMTDPATNWIKARLSLAPVQSLECFNRCSTFCSLPFITQ